MSDTEYQDLEFRFKKAAFYDHLGRGKFTPEIELTNLATVQIIGHRGYKIDWWKEYVGVTTLAKLIFHSTLPTNPMKIDYLYEVIPIMIKGHNVYIAKGIIAKCVRIVEEYQHKMVEIG